MSYSLMILGFFVCLSYLNRILAIWVTTKHLTVGVYYRPCAGVRADDDREVAHHSGVRRRGGRRVRITCCSL